MCYSYRLVACPLCLSWASMKIVISGRYILPRMEGIGRYTREMITHLATTYRDDEFHIVLDRDFRPRWMTELPINIHVLSPQARHPILWSVWYEWRLPRLLKQLKADVLFCPEGYLSKKTDVPTVLTIHDLAYLHHPDGIYTSHLKYLKKNTKAFGVPTCQLAESSQSEPAEPCQ